MDAQQRPLRSCVVGPLLRRWARERPDAARSSSSTMAAPGRSPRSLERVRARGGAACAGSASSSGDAVLCWMPNRREAVLGLVRRQLARRRLRADQHRVAWRAAAARDRAVRRAGDGRACRAAAAAAELDTAQLRDVVVVGADGAPAPPRGRVSRSFIAATRLSTAGRSAAGTDAATALEPWDTICIIFTSGTTGPSKAVLCTYVQAWCGGAMGMDYFGPDDRLLAQPAAVPRQRRRAR